jgi:hypothetical protein
MGCGSRGPATRGPQAALERHDGGLDGLHRHGLGNGSSKPSTVTSRTFVLPSMGRLWDLAVSEASCDMRNVFPGRALIGTAPKDDRRRSRARGRRKDVQGLVCMPRPRPRGFAEVRK